MDPPRTTLCPGYTHVSTFSPSLSSSPSSPNANTNTNSDSEYEEETEYIILDLGNIEPTLVPSSQSYRLIGLDTPTPFLQLSGTILQGKHDDLLGSELIFTDDKDSAVKKKSVMHVSTTSKRISFKEVRLRPKEKQSGEVPTRTTTIIDDDDDDEGGVSDSEDAHIDMDTDGGEEMDVDLERSDALEYVDLSAGPSRLPPPPPPKDKGKGKQKASDDYHPPTTSPEETDGPTDPAMRIDRLTGISPPLTRAPRGAKRKGKQKEKADG